MVAPKISEQEFIRLVEERGIAATARLLSIAPRNVYRRRENIEKKIGRQIKLPGTSLHWSTRHASHHPHRLCFDVADGCVLVGSDLHVWPGTVPVSQRAMVHFIKELKPKAVILNGDVIDAGTISRHPPIGWENQPTLQEEIEEAQDRLHGFVEAMPKGCRKLWLLGNHDGRFETRLATIAPEFAKIAGVHLKDHFPLWEAGWSAWINSNVVIKHRFKGGIHAPHNNTMWAGMSIITGHLHSAKVVPFSDYNGTRYGVDTGCMVDPYASQFVDYTEDSPRNWRESFCVLTFRNGELMMPELILAHGPDHVQFRGDLIKV